MHLKAAVFFPEGTQFLLADNHEEGNISPLEEVVVIGIHLDAAQVGHKAAGVAGVVGRQRLGIAAVVFHFPERPAQQAEQRTRKVGEDLERVVHAHGFTFAADLGHEILHIGMHLLHGGAAIPVQDELGHGFRALVGELPFHIEGNLDFLALVKTVACNEVIHLGTQVDGFCRGGRYEMEPGVLEFRILGILFGQVLVHFGEVHNLSQNGLVDGAVAKEVGHHHVDGVQSAYVPAVPAVSPAFLSPLHRFRYLRFISFCRVGLRKAGSVWLSVSISAPPASHAPVPRQRRWTAGGRLPAPDRPVWSRRRAQTQRPNNAP